MDNTKLKEVLKKAIEIQEVAVKSSEDDQEEAYARGYLMALNNVLDIINSK